MLHVTWVDSSLATVKHNILLFFCYKYYHLIISVINIIGEKFKSCTANDNLQCADICTSQTRGFLFSKNVYGNKMNCTLRKAHVIGGMQPVFLVVQSDP